MKFNYPDWSKVHHESWAKLLAQHMDLDNPLRMVEVGCFEGRSTVWFADYLAHHPNSVLHCIDTWMGGEEIERSNLGFDMSEVMRTFSSNVSQHPQCDKIRIHVESSERGLAGLMGYNAYMDFIYLDGSHTKRDTLVDLVLALVLIRKGGVIVVDDYLNGMNTSDLKLRPKQAVDFVVETFDNQVEFFVTPDRQAVIIKR